MQLQPQRLLAIGAHPDDIDALAGGTIAKIAAGGTHVEYVVCTDGSKGSFDGALSGEALIARRQEEQKGANALLGVSQTHFLNYVDGELAPNDELIRDLVRLVRQVRPDCVIILPPDFVLASQFSHLNHRDHRIAGQAAHDAVYPAAQNSLSFPELLAEGLPPHSVTEIWVIHPLGGHVVDITDTIDLRDHAIKAHASQYGDGQARVERARADAQWLAKETGYRFAERFKLLRF